LAGCLSVTATSTTLTYTLSLPAALPISRDMVAAVLPDPASVGPRMTGKTCAGLWVTGTGKDKDGNATGPRSSYLYHVVDNEWSRSEEHTSELQSREKLVCRLLLEKKNDG